MQTHFGPRQNLSCTLSWQHSSTCCTTPMGFLKGNALTTGNPTETFKWTVFCLIKKRLVYRMIHRKTRFWPDGHVKPLESRWPIVNLGCVMGMIVWSQMQVLHEHFHVPTDPYSPALTQQVLASWDLLKFGMWILESFLCFLPFFGSWKSYGRQIHITFWHRCLIKWAPCWAWVFQLPSSLFSGTLVTSPVNTSLWLTRPQPMPSRKEDLGKELRRIVLRIIYVALPVALSQNSWYTHRIHSNIHIWKKPAWMWKIRTDNPAERPTQTSSNHEAT